MTAVGLALHGWGPGVAAAAERLGFVSLWASDDAGLESYTLLGALAACTSTARLGALVTDVTCRNPAIIAKQVTTIDRISHGRAVLAIGGAGGGQVEEALDICRAMFRDERPVFAGRASRIDGAPNHPPPAQPGGPPIFVADHVALAARRADGVILRCAQQDLAAELEVVARRCGESGRDPRDLRTLWRPPVTGAVAATGVSGLDEVILDLGPLGGTDAAAVMQEALRTAR